MKSTYGRFSIIIQEWIFKFIQPYFRLYLYHKMTCYLLIILKIILYKLTVIAVILVQKHIV